MIGTYFYNKNIRNMVSTFGTIFNNINVKRFTSAGVIKKEIGVPLAYGPKEKFLVRLNQIGKDTTGAATQITLPRMSFEFTSMEYDPARQLQKTRKLFDATNRPTNDGTAAGGKSKMLLENSAMLNGVDRNGFLLERLKDQYIIAEDGTALGGDAGLAAGSRYSVWNPVPFNFNVNLNIMVQYFEDGTQILEQILPYFTPEFNVTLKEMSGMKFTRDIPVIFTGLTTEDSYEGDFLSRRAIIHTLTFIMKGFIYGEKKSTKLVKTVKVNTFDINNTSRQITNSAVVGSIKNISLTNVGQNYLKSTTVTFSGKNGSGSGATAKVDTTGGPITSITISNPGINYQVGDDIIFTATDGVGGGAVAEVTEVDPTLNNKILTISLTDGGSGYITEPTLSIQTEEYYITHEDGGKILLEDGTGAIILPPSVGSGAVLLANGWGQLTDLLLTNAGTGYINPVTVSFENQGARAINGTATAAAYITEPTGADVEQTVTPDPTTADATDTFGFTETISENNR